MYIRIYVNLYICIYVYMYICIYVSTYIGIYVCMYICIHVYAYICIYVHMHICIYLFVYIYIEFMFSFQTCLHLFGLLPGKGAPDSLLFGSSHNRCSGSLCVGRHNSCKSAAKAVRPLAAWINDSAVLPHLQRFCSRLEAFQLRSKIMVCMVCAPGSLMRCKSFPKACCWSCYQ